MSDPVTSENSSSYEINPLKYAKTTDPLKPRNFSPQIEGYLNKRFEFDTALSNRLGLLLLDFQQLCKETFKEQARPPHFIMVWGTVYGREGIVHLKLEGCGPKHLDLARMFENCDVDLVKRYNSAGGFDNFKATLDLCGKAIFKANFDANAPKATPAQGSNKGASAPATPKKMPNFELK